MEKDKEKRKKARELAHAEATQEEDEGKRTPEKINRGDGARDGKRQESMTMHSKKRNTDGKTAIQMEKIEYRWKN